jgi:hypothetical protein
MPLNAASGARSSTAAAATVVADHQRRDTEDREKVRPRTVASTERAHFPRNADDGRGEDKGRRYEWASPPSSHLTEGEPRLSHFAEITASLKP